jgi:hypothetical protein
VHIEVLSEDKSGGLVLEYLMAAILAGRTVKHTYAVRPHRGKGVFPRNEWQKPARFASGLMDLLAAKLRAYTLAFQPDELLLVVVIDADAEPPDKVYAELEHLVRKFGKPLPYVIGISIEEIEAWLLGDPQAIRAAYPEASLKKIASYRQDSICGTWEVLASVIVGRDADRIIRIGYPAVGQYKQEWSRNIAPFLVPDRNQSPSFQRFRHQLARQLSRQEKFALEQPAGDQDQPPEVP